MRRDEGGTESGGAELFFAVSLLVLIEPDALAGLVPLFLLIGPGLQRLLLPPKRFLEVAGLGPRRGKRGLEVGPLPRGQFAGLGGQLNGPLAVANLSFRARCQQPSKIAVGVGVFRIDADDGAIVAGSLVILLLGLVDAGPIEVG